MTRQIDKQQRQSICITAFLYGLISLLVAWRVFVTLRALCPRIPLSGFVAVQLSLSALLPLGFFLPHSKLSKCLHIAGSYFVSFQITFFFAAVFELCARLITVSLLGLLSGVQFAYIALALFAFTALLSVYGMIHVRQVGLTAYDIPCGKPSFAGKHLRIVHLSDLHLGSVNDLAAIRKIVRHVNDLHADLICITGDTFTENTRELFEPREIAASLRSMNSRYGVFTCLGNHDSGAALPDMRRFFESANITLLEDELLRHDGVTLLGRLDMLPTGNRKPIEDCLRGVDRGDLIVVMDHQPGDIERAASAGADLLLSGHTHGGQFYPLSRIVGRIFPHYHGLRRFGSMVSIVSSGTCTTIPHVRISGKSEIIVIDITGEQLA